MRKWFKYTLTDKKEVISCLPVDKDFHEHAEAMGGYLVDESYSSKENFFEKYFHKYHDKRLIYYDMFIRKYLRRGEEILSIGSGRCSNELYLIEDGFNITCSDLEPINYKETISLFSDFKFIKLNILEEIPEKKYDTVICLSLIYLFDNEELSTFFSKIVEILKPNGYLILDSAGSSDEKILSNFINLA